MRKHEVVQNIILTGTSEILGEKRQKLGNIHDSMIFTLLFWCFPRLRMSKRVSLIALARSM